MIIRLDEEYAGKAERVRKAQGDKSATEAVRGLIDCAIVELDSVAVGPAQVSRSRRVVEATARRAKRKGAKS